MKTKNLRIMERGLVDVPVWSDRARDRKWAATVTPNPNAPGGMNRKFWKTGRGSPACGGGPVVCSITRYRHAVKVADAAARDLGAGWTPKVTENLGWHARVVSPCGRLSIDLPVLPRDRGYMAFLGPKEIQPAGKWAEHGDTLREAIENVLNAARRDLGLIEKTIEGLEIPVARRKRVRSKQKALAR